MRGKYDLSTGNENLTGAIKRGFPSLNDLEVQRLGNILLTEISKRITTGERLAFFKPRQDGKVEITVVSLNLIDKEKPVPQLRKVGMKKGGE